MEKKITASEIWFQLRGLEMEKKITALKAAYAARDGVRLRKAAEGVLTHNRKFPFAAMCYGSEGRDIVRLARRITEQAALPF